MHKVRITPGRLAFAAAALTFLACAGGGPRPTPEPAPASTPTAPEVVITLAEYEQLRTGMTLAAAEAVVGGPGTPTSQTEIAGHQALGVMWRGDSLGANAQVMFSGDQLTSKAQFGLR